MSSYSEDFKVELVGEYKNGAKVKDICVHYQIPKSTMYHWIHLYGEIKSRQTAVGMIDYVHLQRRAQRLQEEITIFQECGCTVSAPLHEKTEAMKRLRGHFSTRAMCRVLQVRRSTFLHHLFRSPEIPQWEKDYIKYKELIPIIFDESRQTLGAKKIKYLLEQAGHRVSLKVIRRIMNELDLVPNTPQKQKSKKTPADGNKLYYLNKLNRRFEQPEPNRVWVSDITMCKVESKKYYICVVIDLFSRKVISCEISSKMTTPLVVSAFLVAYINRGQPKNLTFHSDQGGQYISANFRKKLEIYNVVQSFSRPGTPHDNAVAESFFSRLKTEEIERSSYDNVGHLQIEIDEYIDWYNNCRPHQHLNYRTPAEKERLFYEST